MINISSTFKPLTNEIWMRNAKSEKEKFWLIQPMKMGVNYQIKHSGSFLYKMSNEEDLKSYSITKITLPNTMKELEEGQQYLEEPEQTAVQTTTDQQIGRLQKRELPPITKYLVQRDESIVN